MPSNLSAIGIPDHSVEAIQSFAGEAMETATVHECEQGEYRVWTSGDGAEFWIHFDHDGEVIGGNPFFRGKSNFDVRLTSWVSRPDDTPLDGAVHGWADPDDESERDGLFPLVFDLVDAALCKATLLPTVREVSLSAFAQNIQLYQSDTDYIASIVDREIKFSAESFFPTGLMPVDQSYDGPPASLAVFNGHILDHAKLINPISGSSFWWLLVKTAGGSIDVAADPELLSETPSIGGVVSGTYWLCGQITGTENST